MAYVDGSGVPVPLVEAMPFDGKRMFWNDCKPMVSLVR